MVAVTNIFIGFFVILGIVGGIAIITFPFVYIVHLLKMKKIRKNIPDKMKKEVEYARLKKQLERETARVGYEGIAEGEREAERVASITARDSKFVPSSGAIQESEPNEPMVDSGDDEPEERDKPNRFTPI